jgi:hypothetical protein
VETLASYLGFILHEMSARPDSDVGDMTIIRQDKQYADVADANETFDFDAR